MKLTKKMATTAVADFHCSTLKSIVFKRQRKTPKLEFAIWKQCGDDEWLHKQVNQRLLENKHNRNFYSNVAYCMGKFCSCKNFPRSTLADWKISKSD